MSTAISANFVGFLSLELSRQDRKVVWVHLNILWRYFMVYNSTDHRKLLTIFFYNNIEKARTELALFSVEKARVTSNVITLSVLLI